MKNQKPTNEEQPDSKPALVLIATPIGNLEDISLRAVREMQNADLLCCEDTRRTGKLLELLEIHPRPDLLLLNEHTEQTRSAEVIEKILNGQRVGLVSDAGLLDSGCRWPPLRGRPPAPSARHDPQDTDGRSCGA